MKVCYTAIIGNYENLKEPAIVAEGWIYICFTDQPLTSNVWKIIPVSSTTIPDQRLARHIKLQPHVYLPDSEYTFWLDAAFQINIDLNIFWNKYFIPPFTCPDHPIRNCVYREVESCIANRRGEEEQIRAQGAAYKLMNVPAFNGIITSGVLMRQNTLGCRRLCDEWWEELQKYSARDQIAFANISRGWKFNTFVWDYSQSRELRYIRHFKYRH